ncbi:MAG TPA: hypothetical protein VI320_14470 [Terracidiphilus sp.]|jgi:hypothetical protein
MGRLFTLVLLAGLSFEVLAAANAQSQFSSQPSMLDSTTALGDIPGLPAAPRGKSTILGGEISIIDPVRDELTLKVAGQHPVKILFDERTQAFIDGKRISLRQLGHADHASVQTLLDGTNVFALSIHILSQSPQGEYQGRVLNYDSSSNQLTISSAMFPQPLKILVPAGTPVVRVGQTAFVATHLGTADLVKGAMISVTFRSNKEGRGVADQVSVLATPGSTFVFTGNISSLDMHAGRLSIFDPADEKTYQVSFDAANFPSTQNLHAGDPVMVTADFDGDHYVANAITPNN